MARRRTDGTPARVARRSCGSAALALLFLAAPAPPAAAAVTVSPVTAAKGAAAALTFVVLTERTDASTTRVEVTFPSDHAPTGLTADAVPGWNVEVTDAGVDGTAVRAARAVWTAADEASRLGPGRAGTFGVRVAALPSDTDALVFTAAQTYSDGQVVTWNQEAGSTPLLDRPAPVLWLTPLSAPSATPSPTFTEIDAVRASATEPDPDVAVTAVADMGRSRQEDATIGLALGTGLIVLTVAATALGRRRRSSG